MDSNYVIGYDLATPNQPDNTSYHLTIVQGKGNSDKVFACRIEVGLKIEVNESVMNSLENMPYIQNNFKLNIKRLNRYRWSIHFDEK